MGSVSYVSYICAHGGLLFRYNRRLGLEIPFLEQCMSKFAVEFYGPCVRYAIYEEMYWRLEEEKI